MPTKPGDKFGGSMKKLSQYFGNVLHSYCIAFIACVLLLFTGPLWGQIQSQRDYIYIDGKLIAVESQQICSYLINPSSKSFTYSEGTGSISVSAPSGCTWTATKNASWITITGGSSGSGNGTVSYSVAANAGGTRSGIITIGDKQYAINQAAAPCTYSLSPTSASFPSAGGTGNVSVTARSGCTWTATKNASWITITGGSSGSGNGTVSYSVAANAGGARSGIITIGDKQYTINQEATPCTYALSLASASFSPAGGTGNVSVTAPSGCTWTATQNASWITITGGSSGSGNGAIYYSVSGNSGPTRSGNMTIAGNTFPIQQGEYVQPTYMTFNKDIGFAGIGSYTVNTGVPYALIDVEYEFKDWPMSGSPRIYQGQIGPMLYDGKKTISLYHTDVPGEHKFVRIKNALRSDWITLNTQPVFKLRPPKPTWFKFNGSSTSATVTLPGSSTQSAGNAESVTGGFVTILSKYHMLPSGDDLYWPFVMESNGETTSYSGCGEGFSFLVTGVRNQLDSYDDNAWKNINLTVHYIKGPSCP